MFTHHPIAGRGSHYETFDVNRLRRATPHSLLNATIPCILVLALAPMVRAQCTGSESLTAVCKVGSSNKLLGKLKSGVPGRQVTFCYDGGSCQNKLINSRGKAKTVWNPVSGGPHQVVATLACGTDLTDMTNCGTSVINIQLEHSGNINGINFDAVGTGLADPTTGATLVDWEIQNLDPTCDPLAICVPMQLESAGSTVAVQRYGALNMRALTGGTFDVEIVALGLVGNGNVGMSGNFLHGQFLSNGMLSTPRLDGWKDGVVRWDAGSGFGEFRTPENYFGAIDGSPDYAGWLRDTRFRPSNGQDPPSDQDHVFHVQETYRYDSMSRLVRTVRTESTVQPTGREKMCYFWTATAPDQQCRQCPLAGGETVCHTRCPGGQNDCAGYNAWYDCSGGGKCRVSYNPSDCALCP